MSTSDFPRPVTAQESVLGRLREGIITRRIPPGSLLRQDSIAEEFEVSRVPVREALKILEGEGIVEYRPHRGYRVAELSMAALEEIYLIVGLLEAEAVRLAVPRLIDEDLGRMLVAIESIDACDGEDFVSLTRRNREFHYAVYERCGLPRLLKLMNSLWDATDAYQALYYMIPGAVTLVNDEHRSIYAACLERNSGEVVRLFEEHRAHAISGLREIFHDGRV